RAGRQLDARDASRGGDEQLSARADRYVPSVDCRDAEFVGRAPGSVSERRGLRCGEGTHLREPGAARLGGDQCRRFVGSRNGTAQSREKTALRGRESDRRRDIDRGRLDRRSTWIATRASRTALLD